MKQKVLVYGIIFAMTAGFLFLVFQGIKYKRGTPVEVQLPETLILEVPRLDQELDLSRELSLEVWNSLPLTRVKLMYQVTILPWPQRLTPIVAVKAFHNGQDLYFYLRWDDETENRTQEIGKFSDACAIMFNLEEDVKPATIMMGFLSKTNIWQWKASQDREYWAKISPEPKAYVDFYYPFEDQETLPVSKDIPLSAANDLLAVRVGTVTPKEKQLVQAKGIWKDGAWHVVFKRSLKEQDPGVDIAFEAQKPRYCSFGVWSGETGDRGGRKSISEWVEFRVK